MMEDDWRVAKTDAERDVMIQRARIGQTFAKFCFTAAALLTFTIIFLQKLGIPLRHTTKETKMFVFSTYYIIDVSGSPYYEIIYVLQIISVFAIVYAYLGVDIFFGMLVLHISAQLENLQTRLADIKASNRFERVLKDIVMHHTRLIRAVNVIENTYTLLLFMLLLYFGAFNCFSITQIIGIITAKGDYPISVLYFQAGCYINTVAQTSLYCIAGQLLATQSEGVYEAAYNCEWLKLKPKDARNLILIMIRSKKPLYVTAGKLFPMTMLTFCNVRCNFSCYRIFLKYLITISRSVSFQVLKISFSYMSLLLRKL
ncbi:Odorant receptor Or2 [Dufourea novaeangliae]|uniref:Odorant receptor Or2 n=1 Tax=Dufourea novaeangliae TaxID=178035 RepID=A0A154P0L8_DUFNO|nr:Odorant receptor Or2 [Dufourea novaeangliae]